MKQWCYGLAPAPGLLPSEVPDYVGDTSTIVCIDETADGQPPRRHDSITTSRYDTLIGPNHSVDVRIVRRPKDTASITVTMGGSIGETSLETSGVAPLTPAGAAGNKQQLALLNIVSTDDQKCGMYEQRFAPRVPGIATISVSLKPKADAPPPAPSKTETKTDTVTTTDTTVANTKSEHTVSTKTDSTTLPAGAAADPTTSYDFEMLVPHLYSGAIRVGLSSIWGVGDHAYSAQKPAGSDVARVVDNGGSYWSSDLVIGYALFGETLTSKRGRDYVGNYKLRALGHRLGPYFGLGVATAAPSGAGTKVEWLRSFLVGFEYELFQNCSVAFVLSARRVDHIAEGVEVGGPVADMTALTETRLSIGGGIVLNFTPDFLRFTSSIGVGK